MSKERVHFLIRGGLIAALYAALTLVAAPISFGMIQLRISEALCVLPYYEKSAIPGLFVGCLIANIVGGNGVLDIVFGSLATLLAAYLTSKTKNKFLAPLSPVLVNAVVVGIVLYFAIGTPLFLGMLCVAGGEILACYGIGLLLMFGIEQVRLFKVKG